MNMGQIWFVHNPRHYRPQSQTVSRFIALLCQSSLSCLYCQYIETYCVPLVTSGQTLLPRFLWVLHSFFFSFLFPVSCSLRDGGVFSLWEAVERSRRRQVSPNLHASITRWPRLYRNHQPQNCSPLIQKIGRKYLYMLEEKGLTPTPVAPSSSQIYSLRNSATGKFCGSFWIHLGKDDIHREACDFFFKNFKLHLKRLLLFLQCRELPHNFSATLWLQEKTPHSPCLEALRLTDLAAVLIFWGRMREGLLCVWALEWLRCSPWSSCQSMGYRIHVCGQLLPKVTFPYFKSWSSRGGRGHFFLRR